MRAPRVPVPWNKLLERSNLALKFFVLHGEPRGDRGRGRRSAQRARTGGEKRRPGRVCARAGSVPSAQNDARPRRRGRRQSSEHRAEEASRVARSRPRLGPARLRFQKARGGKRSVKRLLRPFGRASRGRRGASLGGRATATEKRARTRAAPFSLRGAACEARSTARFAGSRDETGERRDCVGQAPNAAGFGGTGSECGGAEALRCARRRVPVAGAMVCQIKEQRDVEAEAGCRRVGRGRGVVVPSGRLDDNPAGATTCPLPAPPVRPNAICRAVPPLPSARKRAAVPRMRRCGFAFVRLRGGAVLSPSARSAQRPSSGTEAHLEQPSPAATDANVSVRLMRPPSHRQRRSM